MGKGKKKGKKGGGGAAGGGDRQEADDSKPTASSTPSETKQPAVEGRGAGDAAGASASREQGRAPSSGGGDHGEGRPDQRPPPQKQQVPQQEAQAAGASAWKGQGRAPPRGGDGRGRGRQVPQQEAYAARATSPPVLPEAQRGVGRGTPTQAAKSVSPPVTGPGVSRGSQQQPPLQEKGQTQRGEELADSVRQMQIASRSNGSTGAFQIPPRTSMAKKGRKCHVETNHFRMKINFTGIAYHYDVTVKPELPRRMIRPAVGVFCRTFFNGYNPAFDGRKNMYTAKELPLKGRGVTEGTVKVYDEDRMRDMEFHIEVKFAAHVDMSALQMYLENRNLKMPQDALQAIDVVLRHGPSFTYLPVGRSYFSPQAGQIVDLGGGFEMWYGFYQSAILGWESFVNIDVSHKAFPISENLVDMVKRLFGRRGVLATEQELQRLSFDDRRNEETINKAIKGYRIQYAVGNYKRSYRANGIVGAANRQKFNCEGQQRTVQSYWEEKFPEIRLRYPYLPCVHLGAKDRTIYIPMELCMVVGGQVSNKKLPEDVTASMIKHTATSTEVRKRKIMQAVSQMNRAAAPCVRDFGISVAGEFTKVDARILEAPVLGYENEGKAPVYPRDGVWREKRFIVPKEMKNWCIISLTRMGERELRQLGDKFCRIGREVGMVIDPPSFTDSVQIRGLDEYFKVCVNDKISIVVVVIPDRGDTYSQVKQAAELRHGVLTQCIRERNAFAGKDATLKNICLKLNSKLGGTNHCLFSSSRPAIMNRPVIIFGADVTHPSPDVADTVPSVAAVSASLDPKAFQYAIDFRLQSSRVEIIQDLKEMVVNLIMTFHKKTKLKPERIIFFRDGVSEGQFLQVLQFELTAIRAACTSIHPEYNPPITFLVVQKRHHTRLFPTQSSGSVGKPMNVPPGTVVDTLITHPVNSDYYLVSHQSIQGVSRPTRYRKLWDDNKMSEDDVQELTYFLCHLFARCTRSVSYPSPTYYAHLAAFRARSYLVGKAIRQEDLQRAQESLKVKPELLDRNPFFFV